MLGMRLPFVDAGDVVALVAFLSLRTSWPGGACWAAELLVGVRLHVLALCARHPQLQLGEDSTTLFQLGFRVLGFFGPPHRILLVL